MGAPCCYGSRKLVRPVEILFFPEPAIPEKMCDVVVLLRVTDQMCSRIKHGMQSVQQVTGKTSQSRTAVIKLRCDHDVTSDSRTG